MEKDKMYYRMSFSAGNAPVCIITKREAGSAGRNTAPESANRKIIMDALGIERIYTVSQEHSRIIHDVSAVKGQMLSGDGLVTCGNETLGVTVADCLPVFLYDKKTGAYGIVHSGWKGTGIALKAIAKMKECYGTDYGDVEAVIGPSIGPCCYSVDRGRASEFSSEWGDDSVIIRGNTCYLDLKKANRSLLIKAGVARVTDSGICTSCENDFFSYRRDGVEHFGLMLALIGFFG